MSRMTAKKLNPDSISIEDIQRMSQREFRVYMFFKLNSIDSSVRKMDSRQWATIAGIIVTIGTVILSAVL